MGEFTHPFDIETCTARLYKECVAHNNKLLVAFDFDNTIYDYHNNNGDYSCVIDLLKRCSAIGFIMILFTADEGEKLEWKKKYCEELGIRVDYVNEDPIFKTKKPYYNILLDDRAGLQEAYAVLSNIVMRVEHQNK